MINPAAVKYAGAWIAGQLGGIALGAIFAKKVLPRKPIRVHPKPGAFDAIAELDRLGIRMLS